MSIFEEIDLTKIKTYKAKTRISKVKISQEAIPPRAGITVRELLNNLPSTMKANELKNVAQAVALAKKNSKPVIVMLGGHVIKSGCSPVLSDLAANGFISHFASNGAAAIHDTELASFGHTSEDVASQLEDGSFGMASDTASIVNSAAKLAMEQKRGFGEVIGEMLAQQDTPYTNRALLVQCHKLQLPYTLHVAVGTDIVHQHPTANGAAIGDASLRDFRIFSATVSKIGDGGVILNLGSAVIMPEVFLKALSVARNIGHNIRNFTTANFDMIQHYRPNTNVVNRPVLAGGKGYSITGHHEIMIPLLAAAIYESWEDYRD